MSKYKICRIGSGSATYTDITFEDPKLTAFLNSFSTHFKDNKRIIKRKTNNNNKIFILPFKSNEIYFHLKFVPKIIKEYDFILPIKVSGTDKIILPFQIRIKCNAIGPKKYVYPQ